MMVKYFDREEGRIKEEKIWGRSLIELLYGKGPLNKTLGRLLNILIAGNPIVSFLFGLWHKLPHTRKKIEPFAEKYGIDMQQFVPPPGGYKSFNDFFIRKLKKRSVASGKKKAVIPADARYIFLTDISSSDGFYVKGEKFSLPTLLRDHSLAKKYEKGSMVIGRLSPVDYHRFHFPIDCVPQKVKLINGYLYSVNPIAIRSDIHIFSKNKRTLSILASERFGDVLCMEVGATNVGSIKQTFTPFKAYSKGDEKGFFALGASAIILIFEPGKLVLDADLLSVKEMEIRCLMGQSMGRSGPA